MSKQVYIINDSGEIEQVDYQELCNQFAGETTTPYGVGRIDFYREVKGYETYLTGRDNLDEQTEWFDSHAQAVESAAEFNEDNKDEPAFKPRAVREALRYALRSYNGWDGSSRLHWIVDTETEALEWLDKCARFDFSQNGNAPITFDTREEAEACAREQQE